MFRQNLWVLELPSFSSTQDVSENGSTSIFMAQESNLSINYF